MRKFAKIRTSKTLQPLILGGGIPLIYPLRGPNLNQRSIWWITTQMRKFAKETTFFLQKPDDIPKDMQKLHI